jgi:hypothetical protein
MVAENNNVWRFLRQKGDDAADGGQETHIKHHIRFVQHQHFDAAEVDHPLAFEVQQAARAGYYNIHTAAQAFHLRQGAYAAVNGQAAQAGLTAKLGDGGMGLFSQLARGRKDQGAQVYRAVLSSNAVRIGRTNAAVFPVPV